MMKFYYCKHCKNLELVMHDGGPTPVCCGEPMTALAPNTTDGATEKHLPVVQTSEQSTTIQVGEVTHPMTPEHFIEWIAVTDGQKIEIQHLSPSDQPIMHTNLTLDTNFSVYAYCNLHGLWLAETK